MKIERSKTVLQISFKNLTMKIGRSFMDSDKRHICIFGIIHIKALSEHTYAIHFENRSITHMNHPKTFENGKRGELCTRLGLRIVPVQRV